MKRRCVALLAASVVMAAVAGCGGGSAASGGAHSTIKLGFIGAVTGDGAFIGGPALKGAKAAVAQINGSGGVRGHKLSLVSRDSQGDPTQALSAAREFAADKSILAVVGPDFSSNVKAAEPVLEQAQLPYYIITSVFVPKPDSYMFADYNIEDQTWERTLTYLHDKKGVTHVGILASTDTTGESAVETIDRLAPKVGLKTTAQRFDLNAGDVTPQVRKLQAAHVDGYVIAVTGNAFGVAMRGLSQLGELDKPIGGSDGNVDPSLNDLLKGLKPASLVFSTWTPEVWKELPSSSPQLKQLQALNQRTPVRLTSAAGWDGVRLWAQAADAVLKSGGDLTRQAIKNKAQTLTFVGAIATQHFTRNDHRGTTPNDLFLVQWKGDFHLIPQA